MRAMASPRSRSPTPTGFKSLPWKRGGSFASSGKASDRPTTSWPSTP
jgi:hypothetical protein